MLTEKFLRREGLKRAVESVLWVLIAFLLFITILVDANENRANFEPTIFPLIGVLGPMGLLVLVFVFNLIFSALPLEAIRSRLKNRPREGSPPATSIAVVAEQTPIVISPPAQRGLEHLKSDEMSSLSAAQLFSYYATSSRALSQGLYSRAGVYLFIGVVVAGMGLVFFYVETIQTARDPQSGLSTLIELGPKFGILFFIELVAFFFLRQYRAAMDEFRYYEAIKRNREETLALIRCAAESGKPVDPFDLVKNESFFSKAGVLRADESSEILESRKLEKNEVDLLERVIELIAQSKK